MPKSKFKPEDREKLIDEILHPQEEKLKDLAPPVAEKIKEIAKRLKGSYPRWQ